VVFNKFDTGRSLVLSGIREEVCGRRAKLSAAQASCQCSICKGLALHNRHIVYIKDE